MASFKDWGIGHGALRIRDWKLEIRKEILLKLELTHRLGFYVITSDRDRVPDPQFKLVEQIA
ncbi:MULTISPECIES: hypothetical protein [unclassified Nostoc]|uniref:hypothetical protein n=1 Tax=unclassified Nostoc TaxID=2593658 RepID=UPI002AD3B0C8|nr:hypothetical protein [Nostoc sp. DedQUE03]MDZ7974061.1 hypothetical protein [Nostoc sp. DedQUE03]MDZ8042967.1 hypothetical protein [Nostoc sp. DedQUE02]